MAQAEKHHSIVASFVDDSDDVDSDDQYQMLVGCLLPYWQSRYSVSSLMHKTHLQLDPSSLQDSMYDQYVHRISNVF